MIDVELRHKLVENLRQLRTGCLEPLQFDDAFYFRFSSTDDRAVREIAVLCYSLRPQNSTGDCGSFPAIHSQAMNELLSRAILFLQTEHEYEWPAESLFPGARAVAGLGLFMLLPLAMGLIALSLPLEMVAAQSFMLAFMLFSVAIMFVALKLIAMKPASVPLKSKRLENRGDYEVWPFFRRGDHALAKRG